MKLSCNEEYIKPKQKLQKNVTTHICSICKQAAKSRSFLSHNIDKPSLFLQTADS